MTQYAFQKSHGELETLAKEHRDPQLLFDEKTAQNANEVLNSEPYAIPFDLFRHLHEVREANNSHRANYWLKAMEEKASEYGKTIIDCIEGLPVGVSEAFTNDTLSKAEIVISEQVYSD